MAAKKCVTCTRQFINTHALKTHQPKCKGRANVHAHGLDKTESKKKGRKLAQHMNATEEEVASERQELREPEPGPARKRKSPFNVT
jgi:hypothetical protein